MIITNDEGEINMKKDFEKKVILSALWIFASINFVFCDVMSLMEPKFFKALMEGGNIDGMVLNEQFLFMFAVLLEICFLMIILSLVLKYKVNRILNIVAGLYMTVIQAGSLFASSDNTLHYIFFSIIEIGAYLTIIAYAWRWKANNENSYDTAM